MVSRRECTCCKKELRRTLTHEKKIEFEKGGVADEDGLIGLTYSCDMEWQKRGRAFNSLSGHGAVMGLKNRSSHGLFVKKQKMPFL